MKRDNNNIDELLVKYLLGEASAQEHLTISKWREAKPEHEKYFADFNLIWTQSKNIEQASTTDENAAWERLKLRLQQQTSEHAQPKKIALPLRNLMRVAAILILCVGSYFLYNSQSNKIIVVNSNNLTKTETLPDGSIVTLNKNATISYPKKFDRTSRTVSLSGEAFFNITPDTTKPFIIEANDVKVKVVGTTFNVKTGKNSTEVIVETGIVEVSKGEALARLEPKEKAIVANKSMLKIANPDALYNYYRTNEFVCNNTPLWRLVEVLNEAYNTKIIIANPAIRDLHITATFKNENLDLMLNIISETLDVSVERKGIEIVLQ